MLANIHSILAYDVTRGCRPTPTKFRLNAGPASQPIASFAYDAGPKLIHHWVCCILCGNTCHLPNAVSMLTHSLRRWPGIETALVDCTVFVTATLLCG